MPDLVLKFEGSTCFGSLVIWNLNFDHVIITWWWRHRILSFWYKMSGTFIPFICWAGISSSYFGSLVIGILVVFWTLITWLWRHRAWPKFFKPYLCTAHLGIYNLPKFQVAIYFGSSVKWFTIQNRIYMYL